MKRWLYLIILFMPFIIHAEDRVYEVCKSGCEYNNLQDVFEELTDGSTYDGELYDIYVDIKDSETYDVNLEDIIYTITNPNGQVVNGKGYIYNSTASNFYLRGTNGKPTINSLGHLFGMQFLNANKIEIDNIKINNMSTGEYGNGAFEVYDKDNTQSLTIKNSEIKVKDDIYLVIRNMNILNSSFDTEKMELYTVGGNLNIQDSIIKHKNIFDINRNPNYYDDILDTRVNIKDTKVVTTSNRGITLSGLLKSVLDNVTVSGAIETAIYIYAIYDKASDGFISDTTIKNSDLSDNNVSVIAQGSNVVNKYDITIENSKINKIISIGQNANNAVSGPVIFVDGKTEWVDGIERSTEEDSGTAVEELDGIIYIEEQKIVNFTVDEKKYDEVLLKDLFNFENYDEIEWQSSDEEIVKIVNGKIVPGKDGIGYLYGSYLKNIYKIEVIVDHTSKNNPNTTDKILLSLVVLVIVGICGIAMYTNMKKY